MSDNPQSGDGPMFRFGAIPPRAVSDARLKGRHFRALSAVAIRDQMSLTNDGAGCFSSMKNLAALSALNYSNFSTAVGELVNWGYLSRTKGTKDRRTPTLRVIYLLADNQPWDSEKRGEDSLPTGRSTASDTSDGAGKSFAPVTKDFDEKVCPNVEIVCPDEKISQRDQADAAHKISYLINPESKKSLVVQSTKMEVLDSLPGHLNEDDVKWAIEYWLKQGREDLARDVKEQLYSFEDHHQAKGSHFKDWSAAWRYWCRKGATYPPRKRNPHEVFAAAAASLARDVDWAAFNTPEERAAQEKQRQEADKARFAAGGWLDRAATEPMQVFEEIYGGLKSGAQPTEEAVAALEFIARNNEGRHIADMAQRELLYCRRKAA